MSIKIRFFASLAETVGRREAELAHTADLTVAGVWCAATGQSELPAAVMCAVNHKYCEHTDVLDDDDEVAFFPPVTGG